jgi:hypothetical protein
MPSGIRATVAFTGRSICPILELSRAAGERIDSVVTNVCPAGCTKSVTEFSADIDRTPETDAAVTPVFSHGSTYRYRLTHDGETSCPCECIGQFGCPIVRYVAHERTLTLVFHATDYDQLETIVARLRDRYPSMDLRRFVRSPAGGRASDTALVDRTKLTPRQLEVLETASEMGYFDSPRRANATEVAAELGIHASTLREHLSAAHSKILDDVL